MCGGEADWQFGFGRYQVLDKILVTQSYILQRGTLCGAAFVYKHYKYLEYILVVARLWLNTL